MITTGPEGDISVSDTIQVSGGGAAPSLMVWRPKQWVLAGRKGYRSIWRSMGLTSRYPSRGALHRRIDHKDLTVWALPTDSGIDTTAILEASRSSGAFSVMSLFLVITAALASVQWCGG